MTDYGEAGREFDDAAHQRDPTPDADDAVVYATEFTGTIETVGVREAVAAMGEERACPDGGQTRLDDWEATR